MNHFHLNKTILLALFVVTVNICFPIQTFAQQGACVKVEWSENYGGFQNEASNSLIQTSDGGFLSVGYSRSSNLMLSQNWGKSDFWIIKVDEFGALEWEKNYGGSENDIATDAVQTPDGGFIVVGGTVSFDVDVSGNKGFEDVWVIKINENGSLEWSKTFGGSQNEKAEAIEPTSDGNYVIAGYSDSNDDDVDSNNGDFDFWLLKINGNGDLIWENNYGGSLSDWGFDVKQMADGGFLMVGSTFSNDVDVSINNGFYDYWVIKTDADGVLLWEKNFGGTLEERAYSLSLTSDGGAVITGTSNSSDWDVNSNNGSYDYWIIKIDNNGNLIWSQNLGGPGEDRSFSIVELSEGDYLACGFSANAGTNVSGNYGSLDAWVLRISQSGDLVWEKNLGGSNEDRLYSVLEKSDGGFAASGLSESDDFDLSDNFGQKDKWIISLSPDSISFDLRK